MGEVLSLKLSAEDKARLDWASEKTQRPAAELLREAAQEYLDDLEDYYLGMEALEEVRQTGVVYTEQQMKELCGLED